MTWRRFMVLLRGLSPNAATVVFLQTARPGRADEEVVEVVGPKAAQAAFERLFKPPPGAAAE